MSEGWDFVSGDEGKGLYPQVQAASQYVLYVCEVGWASTGYSSSYGITELEVVAVN